MEPVTVDWRIVARRRIADKVFPRPKFGPVQHPAADSYQERLNRQAALFIWCAFEQDFEFAITIQFGVELREHQIRNAVKRSGAMFDYHWLGRAWANRPSNERTYFVAAVERGKKNSHTHVHMLLRRPPILPSASRDSWRENAQDRSLSYVFTERARRTGICPYGNVYVQRIWRDDDQVVVASYILKDLWGWNSTGLILSNEFHPPHSNARSTATRPRS